MKVEPSREGLNSCRVAVAREEPLERKVAEAIEEEDLEAKASVGLKVSATEDAGGAEEGKKVALTPPKGCEVRAAMNSSGLRRAECRLPLRLAEDGVRGERIADLLCETRSLGMLGLGLAWVAFEGRRSGLCKAWLWQNFGRFLQNGFCEQPGEKRRSLFPFPHVWGRLEAKFKDTLFEDIFFESFWTVTDVVDAWCFLSVKFCQQLFSSDLGFREGKLRKSQRLCLETIRKRLRCS